MVGSFETIHYRALSTEDQAAARMTGTNEREAVARRPGRPRDPDRDRVILDAVIALLSEPNTQRLGMREVATRSGTSLATIYRRWPSREGLLLDAIQRFMETDVPLPETGDLRRDLIAVLDSMRIRRKVFIETLPRLNAEAVSSAEIREAVRTRLLGLAGDRLHTVLLRARSNKIVQPTIDLEFVADAAIALFAQQPIMYGRAPTRANVTRIVDQALMPMLGLGLPRQSPIRSRKG